MMNKDFQIRNFNEILTLDFVQSQHDQLDQKYSASLLPRVNQVILLSQRQPS